MKKVIYEIWVGDCQEGTLYETFESLEDAENWVKKNDPSAIILPKEKEL